MMRKLLLSTAALSALFVASAAHAEPQVQSEYLTLSVGEFDVHDHGTNSASFGLEYRGSPFWYGLLPTAGLAATDDGAYYGYVGLNYDWNVVDGLFFTPSFAVSAYEDGGGKDLGGVLEFRSGVELSYRFPNEHRLGVAYQHMSNAGIYDKNPGAENLLVTYSIPLSIFK